jgi:proteasome lid subunit RPN8/RPN11
MSEPNLIMPPTVATRLCADIRRHGQAGVETGGLLLAKPGDSTVSVVAVAGTTGIVREYGLFIITRPAFDALFTWAEDHELQVRAMVHSHADEAFLSRTDREGGLRVKGFRSAVVPTFDNPPEDPALWRWWTFTSDWTPTQAPRLDPTVTSADSVVFDGDGVRAD